MEASLGVQTGTEPWSSLWGGEEGAEVQNIFLPAKRPSPLAPHLPLPDVGLRAGGVRIQSASPSAGQEQSHRPQGPRKVPGPESAFPSTAIWRLPWPVESMHCRERDLFLLPFPKGPVVLQN